MATDFTIILFRVWKRNQPDPLPPGASFLFSVIQNRANPFFIHPSGAARDFVALRNPQVGDENVLIPGDGHGSHEPRRIGVGRTSNWVGMPLCLDG